MTKEVPRKRFPQALVIFNNVVESADNVPTEVKRLRRAISESLAENNQRSALNRRFCRQREINPKFFPKVVAWLFRQDTVRRFKKAGGYWAVKQLTSALPKISHGAKPHVVTLPLFNGVHSIGYYADFFRCSASQRCSNCIGLM